MSVKALKYIVQQLLTLFDELFECVPPNVDAVREQGIRQLPCGLRDEP